MSLPNDPTIAVRDATQRIEPALIEIRRDIHAHPELGFEEVRTAGVVARELARLGIVHQTGIAPHPRQHSAIAIGGRGVLLQPCRGALRQQPAQSVARRATRRALGQLGAVHPDEADLPPVPAVEGVAVHDPRHHAGRRRGRNRATAGEQDEQQQEIARHAAI